MARTADHVYDHCLAVCRDADLAREAAVIALGRAGRSRPAALAQARRQALAVAPAAVLPAAGLVPADPRELVWALAGAQPADERSLADLATRHGLDRAALGRALGERPPAAVARCDALLDRWEQAFRPAIVAWLGPGACDGLAAILAAAGLAGPLAPGDGTEAAASDGDPPPPAATEEVVRSVGAVTATAPEVAAHLEGCATCRDRVRSMPSVRTLLGKVPLASTPVGIHSGAARRRGNGPAPHPHRPVPAASPRSRLVLAVAAAALAVAAGGAVAASVRGRDGDAVEALTRLPARNALAVSPPRVVPGERFTLRNESGHPVTWHAAGDDTWLRVKPAGGRLAGHASVAVLVTTARDAPEGDVRDRSIVVTASDGSTAQVRVGGAVERPPTVAASVDGCAVTAHVEDESEIASVELHWRAGADAQTRVLAAVDSTWTGSLPRATGLVWWVSATDGRGNSARTDGAAAPDCR